ncbi:hypothetical protein ACVIJ6_001338 [Bradyrhizobium sp. USDA 4369]
MRSGLLAVGMLLLGVVLPGIALSAAAWAQSARAQPAPSAGLRESPTPSGEPAPPPSNPGLVEELGKLFDKMSIIPLKPSADAPVTPPAAGSDPVGAPGDQAAPPAPQAVPNGDAGTAGVLKETGDALSRLAKPSSMVLGRAACPMAANGTPDCKLGADRLCQSKGHKEGKSLNTDSAETCSAKVLIPGRQRKPGDCRTDTFVTSALCQ